MGLRAAARRRPPPTRSTPSAETLFRAYHYVCVYSPVIRIPVICPTTTVLTVPRSSQVACSRRRFLQRHPTRSRTAPPLPHQRRPAPQRHRRLRHHPLDDLGCGEHVVHQIDPLPCPHRTLRKIVGRRCKKGLFLLRLRQ